jgi:hypothetical protein
MRYRDTEIEIQDVEIFCHGVLGKSKDLRTFGLKPSNGAGLRGT